MRAAAGLHKVELPGARNGPVATVYNSSQFLTAPTHLRRGDAVSTRSTKIPIFLGTTGRDIGNECGSDAPAGFAPSHPQTRSRSKKQWRIIRLSPMSGRWPFS